MAASFWANLVLIFSLTSVGCLNSFILLASVVKWLNEFSSMSDCIFLGSSLLYDSIGLTRISFFFKIFGGYGFLRCGAVGRMSSLSLIFYDLSKGFDLISSLIF